MIDITQTFKNYINQIDFYMNEELGEEGTSFFSMNVKTDNGANIRIVVSFQENYPSADVYCFNVADINNPLKRDIALQHINDVNNSYRYAKFHITSEGTVSISTALDFGGDLILK
ncbi:hypothetical protein H70357_31285 [Paenibacillus sp. FSL H7-0357]|uniref:YbjN domain-containing protein n=1 Tax=Paenibacillus sp. FSL H7-0357 TaxID=1536774 RepID=UPI0004F8809A|nr:YbjN domain-containing protein [Paenibacillus sp. FSL H7-0357]AIQ20671.1 hypothetical protein H70357_31285 [Paenibacillus sp. FSL H7-0357]